ncbi:MAG: ABC transporter permease [Candidatus Eiseniibacteriota bacterium]|nr:MAG: ABC transporter permease [Candidatus Eisenbacteria bacterium]
MSVIDILKMAYSSLGTNRLRSLLTMLGVIFGVGAVIAMLAVGSGAKALVESQIASLGTNVIMIFPGATRQHGVSYGAGTSIRLTEDDAVAMLKESGSLMYVSPVARSGGQVVYGNENWATRVEGVYPDYTSIREWSVESGELLTESDERNAAKVCLMGQTVAKALFVDGEDPVGKTIRFRRLPLKVKGLLSAKGPNFFGSDQDDILLVPFSTLQRRILGITWANFIIASAVSRQAVEPATEEITGILRSRHRLKAWEEDDFRIRNQTELADTAAQTSRTLGALLATIASISLLVGGIGIMNIMLVTVTERTREIGVRMSVGARTNDILFQFLVEAIALSCLGGLMGIVLGVVSSRVISAGAGWPVLISPLSIILAVAFAALVGVGFGFYPAWKASHLDPIEALRYE